MATQKIDNKKSKTVEQNKSVNKDTLAAAGIGAAVGVGVSAIMHDGPDDPVTAELETEVAVSDEPNQQYSKVDASEDLNSSNATGEKSNNTNKIGSNNSDSYDSHKPDPGDPDPVNPDNPNPVNPDNPDPVNPDKPNPDNPDNPDPVDPPNPVSSKPDPKFDYSEIDENEDVNDGQIQIVGVIEQKIIGGKEVQAVKIIDPNGEERYLCDYDGDGLFNNIATTNGALYVNSEDKPTQLLAHFTPTDIEFLHQTGGHVPIGYFNPEIAEVQHGEIGDISQFIVNVDGSHTDQPLMASNELSDDSSDKELAGDYTGSLESAQSDELLSGEEVYAQLFGDEVDDSEEYLYDDVLTDEEYESDLVQNDGEMDSDLEAELGLDDIGSELELAYNETESREEITDDEDSEETSEGDVHLIIDGMGKENIVIDDGDGTHIIPIESEDEPEDYVYNPEEANIMDDNIDDEF